MSEQWKIPLLGKMIIAVHILLLTDAAMAYYESGVFFKMFLYSGLIP